MRSGRLGWTLTRAGAIVKTVRVASLFLPLVALWLFPLCGRVEGQQSYQSQKASRRGTAALVTKQAVNSNRPEPPPRFLGWIKAQHDSPEMFDKFAKLRMRKSGQGRMNPNASPTLGVGSRKPRRSPLQAAQTTATIPGILTRPSLPAGAIPTAVVTGDFNGDGKLDWVVANGGDNSLYLYFGNGDGTAQLPIILRLSGRSPVGLATADLNGDGKLDLVVIEADTQSIGILLGNGDGTFQAENELVGLPTTPLCVAVADVNKDGKLDLIVGVSSNNGNVPGPFGVLLGNGGGGFGAPIFAPNGNGLVDQNGYTVSVADVNGDGIPDVLSTGADSLGGSAQIYIGKGDGTFTAGQTLEQGAAMGGFFIDSGILADMNGDGCPDGVVGNNASVVHIYPGDCKGNFDTTLNYQIYGMGDAVFGLAVADLNGDGLPDLVTGGFPFDPGAGTGGMAGNLLGVRLNDGTGHLGPLAVYAGDPGMYSLVITDLLGNGHPEVVTANQDVNTLTVYQNDGAGGFGAPRGGYTGYFDGSGVGTSNPALTEFLVTDVNGDGRQDLVQIQSPSGGSQAPPALNLVVLLNQGNGNFAPPVRSPVLNGDDLLVDFVVANFRNTGTGDFLAEITNPSGSSPVQEVAFAPNTGGGQFGAVTITQAPLQSAGTMASGLGVGDFNKDGKLDFVIVTQSGPQANTYGVEMFLGNGDGTFRESTQTLTGAPINQNELASPIYPAPVYVEDANGDGKLDLLVWFPQAGEVVEFLGNGDGTFQAPTTILQNVQELAVSDLNQDGRLDLVQLNGGSYAIDQSTTVSVYLGKADGSSSGPTTYTPYAGAQAEFIGPAYRTSSTGLFGQVIGDFNGDGNPDIAVFQTGPESEQYVQFLKGNGDGTFVPNYDIFTLGEKDIPALAVQNLLGDGNEVFLHEDDFGATYHIVPASPGPSFQVEMDERPVLGSTDALHISLSTVSASATSFQLTTSDSGVQISAGATVPAGQLTIDVPFTIAQSFNAAKVFSITAQSGTESGVAYNFVSPPSIPSGFSASLLDGISNSSSVSVARGSTSDSISLMVSSQGEASATFQAIGCVGLPAEATCSFQKPSFFVPAGAISIDSFTVSTTANIATGSYPFNVQITDGVETFFPAGTLNVGDFTLSLSPASQTVSTSGVANYTYTIGSIANYNLIVNLSCTNLPSGASCLPLFAYPGSSGPLQVSLNQVAAGDYTVTLTGTSDTVTHTASTQLQVVAVPAVTLSQLQASFTPILVGATSSALQINLQNSGSAPLNIQSIVANTNQGSTGTFGQTNNCGTSLAAGSICQLNATFAPSSVGSASGTIQLTDNASGSPQTITLTAAGVDFSFAAAPGGSTSATITVGQTATYNLEIQPNQFVGAIVLSCSGAPSEAMCSTSPPQIGITNASAATFQVQLGTTARSNAPPLLLWGRTEKNPRGRPALWILACFAVLGYFLVKIRRVSRPVAVTTFLGTIVLIGGCGGGSSGSGPGPTNLGTPAGNYTLTITGQGAGGTRTINLTLTVQ
jgi:hypothetical protein